jgi:hypothetical protein
MMLQYKHRAFKKPLTNANILKSIFPLFTLKTQTHRGWNEWTRNKLLRPMNMWRGKVIFRAGLPDTELHSVTLKSRLSAAICRKGTPLAHDVKPFVQNAQYYQTFTQWCNFCHHIFLRRFCKIAKSDYWLRHVCRSAWKNWAPTGRIFVKLMFEYFSKICRKNSSFITMWQD